MGACDGTWQNSVFVSDISDVGTLDGDRIEIDEPNAAGDFTGQYFPTTGVMQPVTGRCRPVGTHRHISFSRTDGTDVVEYSGKVVAAGGTRHTIIRGRYFIRPLGDAVAAATDTGDWQAQKPGGQ